MFREESRQFSATPSRRSRLEMVCDILAVVSHGAVRPTQIMRKANLTWDDLLMYLEALLRNRLLTRLEEKNRVTYKLTSEGSSLLEHYLKVKEKASPLGLETLTSEKVSRALKSPYPEPQDASIIGEFKQRLIASGFKVLDNNVAGKSGQTHTFSLVVEGNDGSRHGYVFLESIDEQQVLALFVKNLDTDLIVHAYSKQEPSAEVKRLAEGYSIKVSLWEDAGATPGTTKRVIAEPLSFLGKNILLEVDPSVDYEKVVRELASEFVKSGHPVYAFTWKGSPVQRALSAMTGINFYIMSSMATYPKQSGRPDEVLVPQNDQAVLLDVIEKTARSESYTNGLFMFDSLSDLIVNFGPEKSYEFLRNANELLTEPRLASVFILKLGAHDERTVSLIKGIYAHQLLYDSSGLKVTRMA